MVSGLITVASTIGASVTTSVAQLAGKPYVPCEEWTKLTRIVCRAITGLALGAKASIGKTDFVNHSGSQSYMCLYLLGIL